MPGRVRREDDASGQIESPRPKQDVLVGATTGECVIDGCGCATVGRDGRAALSPVPIGQTAGNTGNGPIGCAAGADDPGPGLRVRNGWKYQECDEDPKKQRTASHNLVKLPPLTEQTQ